MVNVRIDVPPARIGVGLNPLAMTGGRSAVSVALPTLLMFVPLSVVERVPLTLPCGQALVAVTWTLTVHEPLAVMVPPVNVNDVAATAGDHVPPQVVLAAGVPATCTPKGSESVNAAPVSGAVFVLVSVNVSVETPPTATGFGAKALAIVGCTAAMQPVNETLSMLLSEPALVLPELNG